METVEKLTEEINLLLDLSKDLSFDSTVMEDAKILIDVKNKSIIDIGGSPVVIEVKDAGISEQQLLDRISVQLKALYPFRNSEKAGAKYRTLDRIFKLKSGVTFDDFKAKGNKFFYGGMLSAYVNFVLSSLPKTNQFFYLRETQDDVLLKYTTPDNSVLYQVLLPNNNVAYGLAYPLDKNTIIDFYQDEELTQSLNLTYSFSASNSEEVFNNEYNEMMKLLQDVEKKYYM